MKKLFVIAALLASASVFAQTSTSGATSGSNSQASSGGNTLTGVGNINCLVNCTDPTAATIQRGADDKAIAGINAAAAKDIATINGQTARDVAGTTQTVKNTPSVAGPNLTTSNDTCMGSTSGSVNIAGLGVGGGTSWVDTNCKMLKNSRELWNMGMKAAALALMCTDESNRDALELTGYECPQTAKAKKVAVETRSPEYTDPIVRQRLGLAPLVASK